MANGTFKISRSRGNAQVPLTIVAALVLVVVLLGKAQSPVLERARGHIADWMAPALEVARAPVDGFSHWLRSVGGIFVVYSENVKLKEENARLRQWHNAAIVLDERLKRYQLLLHAVPDPELSSVLARVIGRSNRPFQQTMILDAGRADGVKPGQAVVDARGMIGRIYIAGQHTAWIILLTDLNSRIPVTIEPGNVQAIMAGDNSSSPTIEVQSWHAHLKGGEQIISSGDGSLLPDGLAIGTITGREGKWRASLIADPASSTDVDVLDYKRPIESPPTPAPGDLPVTAAGLAPAAPERVTPPPVVVPTPNPNGNVAPANVAPSPAAATATTATSAAPKPKEPAGQAPIENQNPAPADSPQGAPDQDNQ